MEECEELERAEDEDLMEDMLETESGGRGGGYGDGEEGDTRMARCMGKLRDMVERPHSGLPGKIFACLSVLFVTITAVNLSVSTMPAMREEEEAVSTQTPPAARLGRYAGITVYQGI